MTIHTPSSQVTEACFDVAQAERRQLIAVTEPRSAAEQMALDAAMTERMLRERYEIALREAYLNLNAGDVLMARHTIAEALRP